MRSQQSAISNQQSAKKSNLPIRSCHCKRSEAISSFYNEITSHPSGVRNDKLRTLNSKLRNEKGIALVMVLVLSAIALAIMAGLIYMLISGTQISGIQKRYKTALEAGTGGAQITFQLIGFRGETSANTILLNELSSLSPAIITPGSCVTRSVSDCTVIGNYTGIATKLNLPTICWTGCDSSLTIDPLVNTTYDMSFQLPGTPNPYTVYAKIADTVLGNSGGEEGLVKGGVVYSTGEVTVVSRPYLYTVEIDAQNIANPAERAKLSILYQY